MLKAYLLNTDELDKLLKNSPLAIISILFCLGILVAKFIHIPSFLVFISAILFLILGLVLSKKDLFFSLFLSMAIISCGFLHFQNTNLYSYRHIINFVSPEVQEVYISGKVVSNPEVSQTFYYSKKTVFTFQARDFKVGHKWQQVEGLIRVSLYGERDANFGDELILQGSLSKPPELRNPGGFNYRAYLSMHNIFGLLKVREKDVFKVMSASPSARLLRRIFQLKQKIHNIIYQHLDPPQAALLSAILIGERTNLSQDTRDLFVNTGTIHILAISGLHVGLIALIAIALFNLLHFPRRKTYILVIFILISYAYLSGLRPSVVRATIMATIVLFGLVINREARVYNSLGLAALLILGFHPQHLFDPGFQLSFLTVISIVYFSPKIEKLFPRQNRFQIYLSKALSVSLAAWLGSAPLVAFYFNLISPIAIFANLIVIPLLFLVVALGATFLFFSYFWPVLGVIFSQTLWLCLIALIKIPALFESLPFGFFHCPSPNFSLFIGYYLFLILIFNHRELKISYGSIAILALLSINMVIWMPLFAKPGEKLVVTFFDVGHGDSIFIEFPDKGTMLIDGGSGGENDVGRRIILPYLWNRGIRYIDAIVLTHPDSDHLGGLVSVLNEMPVAHVFDNGSYKETDNYKKFRELVDSKVPNYYKVKRGDQIKGFDKVKLYLMHPSQDLLKDTGADLNNNSVVLKLTFKDTVFLFCGDLQQEGIKDINSLGSALKSTVVKVPHHGTNEGEEEYRFFKNISPSIAVISAHQDKRFDCLSAEVRDQLKQINVQVYSTGECGAITISTDGQKVFVETTSTLSCL